MIGNNSPKQAKWHVRAYLAEETIQRLESIIGKKIRTRIDFYLNAALDELISGEEIKRKKEGKKGDEEPCEFFTNVLGDCNQC